MGVLDQLDWPTTATWGFFAVCAGLALVAQTHAHVRAAFHRWRLDRRLARNPTIQRDELREYEYAIGEDRGPLEPAAVAGRALLAAALAAAPIWLAEIHLEDWWHYGHWILLGGGLLYAVWRWHNDPPELRGEDAHHPALAFLAERDAVLGLGSAIVVVLLILVAVMALF